MVVRSKKRRQSHPMPEASSETAALALVNTGLRSMRGQLREMSARLTEIDHQNQTIQEYASKAWNERVHILDAYFGLNRALLRVLDNYGQILDTNADLAPLVTELRAIVEQQNILPLVVKEGDPFQAERHLCEDTIETEKYAPNTVVQVLEDGFEKVLEDGMHIIVRPAKVVISR